MKETVKEIRPAADTFKKEIQNLEFTKQIEHFRKKLDEMVEKKTPLRGILVQSYYLAIFDGDTAKNNISLVNQMAELQKKLLESVEYLRQRSMTSYLKGTSDTMDVSPDDVSLAAISSGNVLREMRNIVKIAQAIIDLNKKIDMKIV